MSPCMIGEHLIRSIGTGTPMAACIDEWLHKHIVNRHGNTNSIAALPLNKNKIDCLAHVSNLSSSIIRTDTHISVLYLNLTWVGKAQIPLGRVFPWNRTSKKKSSMELKQQQKHIVDIG